MRQFNTIKDRTEEGSFKWNEMHIENPSHDMDAYPFTVADVDMPYPSFFINEMKQVIEHTIFGYTQPTPAYYDAVLNWYRAQHGISINADMIVHAPGVVNAINNAILALTEPGDGITIMSPVYYPFRRSIALLNRTVVTTSLVALNDTYIIDFDDLESALKKSKVLLLCSPHNPVGRVWTQTELKHIVKLCERYNVLIFSDEIHADIIMPGFHHTSLLTFGHDTRERLITFMSASKTFNIAGLQNAHVIIPNAIHRKQYIDTVTQMGQSTQTNALGLKATEIVYREGAKWRHDFITLIYNNHCFIKSYIAEMNLPITVYDLEGTYLQWLGFDKTKMSDECLHQTLIDHSIFLSPGIKFGPEGTLKMRMNIACPTLQIAGVLNRLYERFRHV